MTRAATAAHGRSSGGNFDLKQITEYVMNGFQPGRALVENISGSARQYRHIAA